MRFILGALLALVVLPAAAVAAPPVTVTRGADDVTQTTATLTGAVNPKGQHTVYFFRYGPTKEYGSVTGLADAGSGGKRRDAAAAIGGLTPFTRIHFRLVAQRGDRQFPGEDRVFRTRKQPLGLTLGADPETVRFGGATTLSGTLAGTDAPGRQVVLQANPWPYTQGFQDVGNPQVVGETGAFSAPVLDQRVNSQYRVLIPGKPEVVSPIVFLGVRVAVSTKLRKVRRHRYRFSGSLSPESPGAVVAIERRVPGGWKTVKRTVAGVQSGFRRKVTLRRRGTFRVAVSNVDARYVANHGRSIRIRPNR